MHKRTLVKAIGLVVIVIVLMSGRALTAAGQLPALNIKIEKVTDDAFPSVQVLVSVTDGQGFPIKNLQADHFKVTEGGKPVAGFSVSPFQNYDQPLAIVLAMDTSGSMQGPPLADSIQAAKEFNRSLAPQDFLGVVTFAAEVKQLQTLTTDRAAVEAQLDTLKAEGATALNDALVEAVGMLKNRSERRVIVLLTDGKQEGPTKYQADDAIDEAVRWSVPIYAIGFGSVDKNQLERFAALTGGTSQINPDSTTVAPAFQTVLSMLREQYLIEFTSTLMADGLEHPLEVSVEYQNGFAAASRNFNAPPGPVTVNVLEPPSGHALGGKVRISAKGAAPAPISQVDIYLDGQPLANLQSPPFEYLWDTTTVPPGPYTLRVVVTDLVGNTGESTVPVEVRLPLLIDLGVEDNASLGGEAPLSVAIDHLVEVAKVTYFVDDTLIAEVTAPPYEAAWDTTQISPGPHTLRVLVEDIEGHTAEDSVLVTVEMQKRSNMIWVALLVLLAAAAMIIPLSMRSRRRMVYAGSSGEVKSEEDGAATLLPGAAIGGAVLIETAGLNPGQSWPLATGPVRMGRKRSDNDIPLQGLSASRMQAVIESGPDGYRIRSLVGDNPVTVNGQPVPDYVILCHGDVIQAGESFFRFEVRS